MLHLVVVMLLSSVAYSQAWNDSNDPFKMDANFVSIFENLPSNGELKDHRKAWPASHWANYVGGIANRWSAAVPENFSYKSYSLKELKKLEEYKLEYLSPAEKFDIWRRDYAYSTVNKVWSEVSPNENHWHGICHGTAPATLNHPEPKTVTLTNKDGITLTFYSSDVAALMSYYYARVGKSQVRLIGRRCNASSGEMDSPRYQDYCGDINPGAFHIIMANKLGSSGAGFISDVERLSEVWNHVATKFTSNVLSEDAPTSKSAPETFRRLHIETTVTYAGEIAPKFHPVIGTEDAIYFDQYYEYFLDLDANGYILGGEWIGSKRPDFVWVQDPMNFSGKWASINEIYRPID